MRERFGHWARIIAGVTGPGVRESRLATVRGKVVLVTGASEGIGRASARRLAQAGATVLLTARTVQRLEELRDEIVAAGGSAHVHPADLSKPTQAEALGEELLRAHGRIDVLVHCAGRSIRRSLNDTTERFHDLQRTTDLNHLGPVALLLAVLPAMRAIGGGHVVNVSTAGLSAPAQNWSSYLSSKAAFDTWLRSAAPEMRTWGITVSTLYCGLVRTRMSVPTAHYRHVPAMSADEAAGMVCRAVANRPRTQQAWWARLGEVPATALKGSTERIFATQLRLAPVTDTAHAMRELGLLRPGRLARLVRAQSTYGSSLAAAEAAAPGSGTALVDRDGTFSRQALDDAANACAAGAHRLFGVVAGERVAISAGSHRGFAIAGVALGRLGVDAVLLPPDLPAERLNVILARERVRAVVHDGEFEADVPNASWSDLVEVGSGARPPSRRRPSSLVVLTSGTTGTPDGVQRRLDLGMLLGPVTTHLKMIPTRPGVPMVVATPPHHGYGLAYLAAGLALGIPVVLAAGMEAEAILELTSQHRASALFALPIQLSRICDLPDPLPDLSALRALVTGAAPLQPALCRRLLDRFGDRVFNMYGTTETGWAAIASPADLRAAPGTVGRPPHGIRITIRDEHGRVLPPGHRGQVHVQGWDPNGAVVPTEDMGELDRVGRLLLAGRSDDMVISGGENVYPAPVEATIAGHPEVVDVRIEPVADDEFGQRLQAWVRTSPDSTLTESILRAWLRERLAPAEFPRDLHFVNHLPG